MSNQTVTETNTAQSAEYQKAHDIDLAVRVHIIPEPKRNTLAFASVNIGGVFAIQGLKVIDSEKGRFVSMPSTRDQFGEYKDVCFPTSRPFRDRLNAAVLEGYDAALEKAAAKESVRDQIKAGAPAQQSDAPREKTAAKAKSGQER